MTGAPLPPGAETVVPVEWTDGGLGEGPVAGMRARSLAPEDAEGQVHVYPFFFFLPGRGTRARPREGQRRQVGRAAPWRPARSSARRKSRCSPRSAGAGSASRPRPRVVVLSTGSELVQPDEELAQRQIYDSNSFALTAAARDAGAIACRVGAVADDAETLRSTIEDQLVRADLMVTTGGVSVGAYGVVKEALAHVADEDEPGAAWTSASSPMRPGKPQGFGSIGPDHTPLLALPGNPVSSYVSFELFVRPAIRTLMGLADVHRPTTTASLAAGRR